MLVLIGVFLLIQQRTAQTGMASLSVLAILSVTHWFWLPVRYKFNSYGLERRFFGVPQRFPWARIEAFRPLKDGILLSRSTATSDSLHTMFIAWSNRRHELESMVTYLTRQVSRKHGSSNSIRS